PRCGGTAGPGGEGDLHGPEAGTTGTAVDEKLVAGRNTALRYERLACGNTGYGYGRRIGKTEIIGQVRSISRLADGEFRKATTAAERNRRHEPDPVARRKTANILAHDEHRPRPVEPGHERHGFAHKGQPAHQRLP